MIELQVRPRLSVQVFGSGGLWMRVWLESLRNKGNMSLPCTYLVDVGRTVGGQYEDNQLFVRYGCFKYGLALSMATLVVGILGLPALVELLIFIIVFYLIEIQFLFLFPILIDRTNLPFRASVHMTYRMGYIRAFYTVLLLAAYMLTGLMMRRDPFRKWHIGCLAVLILYQHELENRLS
jgi:hypothetical protein